jgi:hypothetical protein
MQKPFRDGKGFYSRHVYKKRSQNVYWTYCDMYVWCLTSSENIYFCPNYPIKMKVPMRVSDELGMRNKETFVA